MTVQPRIRFTAKTGAPIDRVPDATRNPLRRLAARLVAFADEINLSRALTGQEVEDLWQAIYVSEGHDARRAWTSDDDASLIQMAERAMLAPAVAVELGRSPAAVRSRIRQLRKNGASLPCRARRLGTKEGNSDGCR